ncbi:MAG: YidC/Oxa1 family insertase periplasmic-domain containing protein [Planctomycetes bacterium]|nr:YidC/Oxa1 family insertase periplasmic-domain containing protein [Planctomycetota bacterium]
MRTLVTIAAILIGLAVVFAVFINSKAPHAPNAAPTTVTQPAIATPSTAPTTTPAPAASQAAEVTTPSAPAATQPATQANTTYDARFATEARVPTLGSNRKDSGYLVKTDLSGWGASVLNISLTNYDAQVLKPSPYVVQTAVKNPDDASRFIYPFAARAIYIDNQRVELGGRWELLSPSTYRTTRNAPLEVAGAPIFDRAEYGLTIVDAAGRPAVELRRAYVVEKNSYGIRCEQSITNVSGSPLVIAWEQNTHADMPSDDASYMGDRRLEAIGYFNTEYDPSRKHIYIDRTFNPRLTVLDMVAKDKPIWPVPELPVKAEMAWVASSNRYFAAVTHRVMPTLAESTRPAPIPALGQTFPSIHCQVFGTLGDRDHDHRVLVTAITSNPATLAPRGTEHLDLALYAGPREQGVFSQYPYDVLHLPKLILYSLGGACSFCTFQWLAHGLLWVLNAIHFIVRDWGLAIMLLVAIVRLLLHPITRRSQINMAKMGKQMQTLQPEIEKIKKKYKDDQTTLNSEMMKLYREKGVNPANMLGCLPMFLQTPIWIALYAMLYYAIELRHQHAFYGVFQAVSNNHWQFLADLSRADRFLVFSEEPVRVSFPLLASIDFSSLNILPLLMAVVFYFQQKLTVQPAANEQAAQQQKIMKWMVLLFPVMLYSAPSGLTLYIMVSTLAGIVDSLIVKRHIKREEEEGTLFKPKKPPTPGGFRDRISRMLEAKQQELMQNRQNSQRKRRD